MMKRKITFFIVCFLTTAMFAQNGNTDERLSNIDWKEDSAEVTTIKDIIREQQAVTIHYATEKHYVEVWSRRSFFNFTYNNTTLKPKDNIPTGVSGLNGGYAPEFKSDWGFSFQYGRSYRLHKKPIGSVLQFYIDYTGIDLNLNHFKAEGNGKNLYDSNQKFDNKYYYTPWNIEKYEANYGMSLGPSLTIAPFTLVRSEGLHFLKLNMFAHIGYHASVIYMPDDKDADVNQGTDDASKKNSKEYEDHMTMDWGHGMFYSFGVGLSWKAIGVVYEHRVGKLKYKSVSTGTFGKDEYDFDTTSNRLSLQIRM